MKDIKTMKQELEQIQSGLFSTCLDRISRSYKSEPEKRDLIIQGLEGIISLIENGGVTEEKESSVNPFDRLEAKITRIKAGLTQKQVAKILGISQGCIAKYESGEVIPNPYNKRGNAIKYLDFLKGNGYNPFEI